ncbi:hypothetical protein HGRIS_010240 [Hohenbuehelia grisea]|uniref:DUF5648 domain-containing protein n=1 Tax=Hohenbuehelia grisea TaxID=104357 RepID=A0ABR3J429_9AGAR
MCRAAPKVAANFVRMAHGPARNTFFTADPASQASASGRFGFNYVGIAGRVLKCPIPGSVPLYYLAHPHLVEHTYTASEAERDLLIARGYRLNGIAGYVFNRPVCGSVPLYKWKVIATNKHDMTIDKAEHDVRAANGLNIDLGVVAYVLPVA